MVGIPGRSGGCATCRRKKKGCDKKVPFCGQCIKAGLVCEGYGGRRPTIWINATDGENHSYTALHTRSSETPAITLHGSLVRSARENRYVGLYLTAFLPNGRLFSRDAAWISSAGWLRYYESLCRSEKTLQLITLAHGLSMLATRDNDSQLKLKGFQAHRMALQEMRVGLQDPQRSTGDGLLAAVRLFRFYEILYGAESSEPRRANPVPQVEGYYAHTDGEMALFMNRGYDKKWSEAGRYLLASGRIVSFILGVGRRKHSPFSDIKWVTEPWKDTKKSPLEQLTDIMVQTPGLLEELDTIRASPVAERSPHAWNDLHVKCYHIEQALIAWKMAMKKDLQIYDYTSSGDGNTLPIPQIDRDYALLHLSFFYWGCSILLYTTIHMAATEADRDQLPITRPSPIPFSSHGHPNYQDERNPTLHAHRIIHAIPLSYSPHAGGYAALSSTFPLGIARRYLLVAHCFPHEGGSQGMLQEDLQEMLSQPFMAAYSARFIDHLHKVDTPAQSLKDLTGWRGMELRSMRWWFGPAVEEYGYSVLEVA
ncbi:hypothetical protein BO71DRAFT_347838 [Aspergillus ellipticus CBS 707.79]|uniref:Zn(2)-C6 fungal-type domain-containing protein n=1 Tax=Aspergillus ellipticus CBS 707.79 TaxID=1448320 RepID=A0A319DIC3_9EURO|nr:hypothetical protein BO71DRAFT_347838 [Aspergillus ellipticus CBS 707.79]